jgi:hypothetical protein
VLSATSSRDSVWIIYLIPNLHQNLSPHNANLDFSQSWARYTQHEPLMSLALGRHFVFNAKPCIMHEKQPSLNCFVNFLENIARKVLQTLVAPHFAPFRP